MNAKSVNPILNVTSVLDSIAWFEKLGWVKNWDWGTPPTFASVGSGEVSIFLCQGAQGGRGKSDLPTNKEADQTGDKGVWMSIWVEDVDAVHAEALAQAIEVSMPPTNEPWGVREMHLRHPDGHVFRISRGIGGHEHD